jgi:hypothetical protein
MLWVNEPGKETKIVDENRKSLVVPAWCPVCQMPMMGQSSNRSFYSHGCCASCFIQWVEDREERWTAGWRPSADDLKVWLDGIYPGE